ncbi:hypothetical protein [Paludibaculum fermentans]|uniref:hypothetical protein n=1 Tax=Paludibaculum fermentans TaxID=1473598 RepID=UPI003EB6CC50
MVQAGWCGQDGAFDAAELHLDPAGVAIESLDVAVLAEDPVVGDVFVALPVFETGVEEGAFSALLDDEVALEHVPLESEGAQGWVGQVLGVSFGDGSEVGFESGRHAVVFAVGSGAAGVFGDFGFAGDGSGASGFLGVGSVGSEAAFGDLGCGHGVLFYGSRVCSLRFSAPVDGDRCVDWFGDVHRKCPL